MKLIQRIAKILPILVIPSYYTYNKYWTIDGDPYKVQLTQSILNSENNNSHIDEQQSSQENKDVVQQKTTDDLEKQLKKQQLIINSKQINSLHKEQDPQTKKQQTEIKEQATEKTKQFISQPIITREGQLNMKEQIKQITTDYLLEQLKPNEAIVSQSCPKHIRQYLNRLNFKIKATNQQQQRLTIKNKRNQTQTFNIKDIVFQSKDEMQLISNFINPPEEIYNIQDINHKLNHMDKDQFIVYTYIPTKSQYQAQLSTQTTPFSTFNNSRKANIEQLQKNFVRYANNSSSNKNIYIILRTKEAANYLKANTFHIGHPYILNKTSKQSGNESNTERLGQRFNIHSISNKAASDKQYFNKITHLYINKIETEVEMIGKIRQIQMSADRRKVLLIYSKEKQQFHRQVQKILEQLSRIQRQHVIVIKTNNQNILKNIFKIQADKFTTIRLFDLHSKQQSLFSQIDNEIKNQQIFYKRSKYKGPFKLQNLCQFVKKKDLVQHYQSKHLTSLKTALPEQLRSLDNTLLLLHKERCKGCEYMQETLDQLKKIIQRLRCNNRMSKHLIYQYKIEDLRSLENTRIRRYNILTQDANFMPPKVTPQLYYLKNGKYIDLNVSSILKIFHERKNNQRDSNIHDQILSQIINKIRLSHKSDQFLQF